MSRLLEALQNPDIWQYIGNVGAGVNRAAGGQPFDISQANAGLAQANQQRRMKQKLGGLMAGMGYGEDSPQAQYADIFPQAAGQALGGQVFPQGDAKRYNVGGALVDASGKVVYSAPEKSDPLSAIAKLEADRRANRIDEATYEAAKAKALTSSGGITIGPDGTVQIGGPAGGGFGKASQTKLEEKAINSGEMLARMTDISGAFKPEYLEVMTRGGFAWDELKDKWRALAPEDRAPLAEYARFRSGTIDNLNQILKEMSGAAVTPQEYERIKTVMPNAGTGIWDGDSPTVFKSKLDRAVKSTRLALARYNYWKAQGSVDAPEKLATIEGMEDFMREKTRELVGQLRAQNPDMPADQIAEQAGFMVSRMFGI